MNKNIRRGLIAAATLSALVLAGCSAVTDDGGSAGDDAQAPAEITFLTFQSPNLTEQFWEDQIAEIQNTYPNLKVNIEYTPGLDRQGYAKQLLASGTLPDVVWDVPLNDFVAAGALLPYEASDLEKIDVPEGTGQIDGKTYSLTVGVQAIPMVYYNKDEFERLGLKLPTTLDELADVADAIKSDGQTPFLIGGASDLWTSTMLLDGMITADVLGANPEWAVQRKAGEVSFSDPDFKTTVERWKGWFDKGYFNSDALTLDYAKLSAAFAAGAGVMYPMGSWAGTTTADFNVGVFPLPSSNGDVVIGQNYGQALAISATTKYPAQARALAVALGTGNGAVLANLQSDSTIPVIKGFEVPSDTASLIQETFAAYQTEGAKRVEPFGWTQGANALPSGFGDEFNKGAQGLLLGGSVDEFLSNMDKTYDDLNQ